MDNKKKKNIFITICIVAIIIIIYLFYLLFAIAINAPLFIRLIILLAILYFGYVLIKVGIERIEEIKKEDEDDYRKY